MSEAALACDEYFTWDNYRKWPDNERWEIIGGEAFSMAPAPSTRHQKIAARLTRFLEEHFEKHPCDVYIAPTDVKLSEDDVVQPDLLVVCEEDKVKETHIEGAPALIIEILSPSTAFYDRSRKLSLYAENGVAEVWLVTPYPHAVEIFVLDGKSYRLAVVYGRDDKLESRLFPELTIDLDKIFDFPIADSERIMLIKEGRPSYGKNAKD